MAICGGNVDAGSGQRRAGHVRRDDDTPRAQFRQAGAAPEGGEEIQDCPMNTVQERLMNPVVARTR